jgi:photosystem II stability/assembly factor-like uncharacterized protein
MDGGVSWSPIATGLDDANYFDIAIDPQQPATLYAGTDRGVYKSTDAGGSWSAANNGFPEKYIRIWCLAIDPVQTSIIYAATDKGVYRSLDGGGNWELFNSGLDDFLVNVLVFAPTTPPILYAGTSNGGVFVHR